MDVQGILWTCSFGILGPLTWHCLCWAAPPTCPEPWIVCLQNLAPIPGAGVVRPGAVEGDRLFTTVVSGWCVLGGI